jgi:hypothetical protein
LLSSKGHLYTSSKAPPCISSDLSLTIISTSLSTTTNTLADRLPHTTDGTGDSPGARRTPTPERRNLRGGRTPASVLESVGNAHDVVETVVDAINTLADALDSTGTSTPGTPTGEEAISPLDIEGARAAALEGSGNAVTSSQEPEAILRRASATIEAAHNRIAELLAQIRELDSRLPPSTHHHTPQRTGSATGGAGGVLHDDDDSSRTGSVMTSRDGSSLRAGAGGGVSNNSGGEGVGSSRMAPAHRAIVLSDNPSDGDREFEENLRRHMQRLRSMLPERVMQRLEGFEASRAARASNTSNTQNTSRQPGTMNAWPPFPLSDGNNNTTNTAINDNNATFAPSLFNPIPPLYPEALPANPSPLASATSPPPPVVPRVPWRDRYRRRSDAPDDGSTTLGRRVAARLAQGPQSPSGTVSSANNSTNGSSLNNIDAYNPWNAPWGNNNGALASTATTTTPGSGSGSTTARDSMLHRLLESARYSETVYRRQQLGIEGADNDLPSSSGDGSSNGGSGSGNTLAIIITRPGVLRDLFGPGGSSSSALLPAPSLPSTPSPPQPQPPMAPRIPNARPEAILRRNQVRQLGAQVASAQQAQGSGGPIQSGVLSRRRAGSVGTIGGNGNSNTMEQYTSESANAPGSPSWGLYPSGSGALSPPPPSQQQQQQQQSAGRSPPYIVRRRFDANGDEVWHRINTGEWSWWSSEGENSTPPSTAPQGSRNSREPLTPRSPPPASGGEEGSSNNNDLRTSLRARLLSDLRADGECF